MAVINISKKSPSLRPFSNVSSGGLGGGGVHVKYMKRTKANITVL